MEPRAVDLLSLNNPLKPPMLQSPRPQIALTALFALTLIPLGYHLVSPQKTQETHRAALAVTNHDHSRCAHTTEARNSVKAAKITPLWQLKPIPQPTRQPAAKKAPA